MIGAGVFGIMINPPFVLYFIQGINTTPIHGHSALFGVYGLLAISLMLFAMRNIVKLAAWSDRLPEVELLGAERRPSGLMTVVSLVPSGFYQFYFAVKDGMWYARSPEVTGSAFIHAVTWARVVPDLIFDVGALSLLAFVVRAIAIDVRVRRAAKGHEPIALPDVDAEPEAAA